ncbi:MAG TPA: hypothetical protein ACFYEF_03625 [Candidatus Wunengus sp. YC63]|uniref:hypothetical protein n=1 Tax=unclassified Candidatus Wunengus TaxID=3367695 RepID=UPI0040267058
MTKKLFLQTSILSFILCLFVLKPAHAFLSKLTPEQVQEAIVYGQKNKNLDMATFSKPWTVSLGKGKGSASLFTAYHNLAYKARKAAVERREFTIQNIEEALDIGSTLTFSVTVYGDEDNFAMYYTAKIYQKDDVIQPEFEFAPEIADASEFWPNSPSNTARLVFKFPAKDIDLNTLISFVIVAPGGEEIPFDFDLPKMK